MHNNYNNKQNVDTLTVNTQTLLLPSCIILSQSDEREQRRVSQMLKASENNPGQTIGSLCHETET